MNSDVTLPTVPRGGQTPVSGLKPLDGRGAVGSVASPSRTDDIASSKEQTSAEQKPPLDAESMRKAVDEVKSHIQMVRRDLEFSIDEDTEEVVVKVLDRESGDVIRQFPSEEILAMIKNMRELGELGNTGGDANKGLLFTGKA